MRIIRKFAIQGHAVPLQVHSPRGPFPPEVLAEPEAEYDQEEHSDSLHPGLDNVRFFKCKYCDDVLLEAELETHLCDEFE